jgi:hypothetical protein
MDQARQARLKPGSSQARSPTSRVQILPTLQCNQPHHNKFNTNQSTTWRSVASATLQTRNLAAPVILLRTVTISVKNRLVIA